MWRSRRTRLGLALVILGAAVAAAGCSGATARDAATRTPSVSASQDPTVVPIAYRATDLMVGGARTMRVEIASTPEQSERGLGYRDTLDAGAGMIFDLHQIRVPVFWMRGMRFPLDLVWIDDAKRVTGVARDVPPQPGVADRDLRRYSPAGPARYVLEVNGGAADGLGLTVGAQLSFKLPVP